MITLKEGAVAFQPKTTRNIAELDRVSIATPMQAREGVGQDGQPYKYQVALVNGEEFRVPDSVLSQIKTILQVKPNLQNVKVIKKGSGMGTEYSVIPLD
jgi:hypothetical protein